MESTNEQEMIALPIGLGLRIWEELREKHGISPRFNRSGLMDLSFSEEELAMITTLKIENPSRGELKGISKLSNLQKLDIRSDTAGDYSKDNMICTITQKEIEEIGQMSSLRTLILNNQRDIEYIDVSQLENLEFLSITNSPKLEEIYGIEKLNKLYGLTCYGNRALMRD